MKLITTLLFFFFFLNSLVHAQMQQELELDLSSIEPGSSKLISENENLKIETIKLLNKLPGINYSVWVEKELRLLKPLIFGEPESTKKQVELDKCQELVALMDSLMNKVDYISISEKKVSELIDNLNSEIDKCRQNIEEIDDEEKKKYKDLFLEVDQFIKSFEQEISLEFDVRTGETVRVYVSRDELLWTFTLKGRQPGKWVTTYGFGFTPQQFEGSTYFTKQIPDTTVFQIFKDQKTDWPEFLDLNYVPAIFFSYFPSQRFDKSWNRSWSAGLGFDLSAPVVFFGGNFMYRHNIGFTAGIAFQQQYSLKNQYFENEIISLSLDKDQLHDKIYRPNAFVSINFRFGENPFESVQSATTDE